MKVDVLQVEYVRIKWFRWFSNLVDICTFDYAGNGYLLQMRISRTNAKQFKAVQMKGFMGIDHPSSQTVGSLLGMNDDK